MTKEIIILDCSNNNHREQKELNELDTKKMIKCVDDIKKILEDKVEDEIKNIIPKREILIRVCYWNEDLKEYTNEFLESHKVKKEDIIGDNNGIIMMNKKRIEELK